MQSTHAHAHAHTHKQTYRCTHTHTVYPPHTWKKDTHLPGTSVLGLYHPIDTADTKPAHQPANERMSLDNASITQVEHPCSYAGSYSFSVALLSEN